MVVRCTPAGPRFLLIRDQHHNWGFPKGHLDPGEIPEQAARREVGEETGILDLELHDALGPIDWFFRARGRLVHKVCHFFLFTSAEGEPVPQLEEGIMACTWDGYEEASGKLRYENSKGLLRRANEWAGPFCGNGRV